PDPSIIRVGSDYFPVTSPFEYFPGIPIYHSKNLIQWELIGHVLTRSSQLNMRTVEPSGGVWAPTSRYHKQRQRFYVSVGVTQRFRPDTWDLTIPCGFQVWKDDIFKRGSWSDPTYFDVLGIDQDLFFDDDGKTYFSTVNMVRDPSVIAGGLCLATSTCEIDLDSGNSLSPSSWVRIWSAPNGVAEGPHIFKLDEYWYLSTAKGGTDEGHQQWISRSTTGLLGSWETGPEGTVNPLIFKDDHAEIRNTGHMDMVTDTEGNRWAVLLGVRPQGAVGELLSSLGRETLMEWSDDGWSVINDREPIILTCEGPGLPLLDPPSSWRDDFDDLELHISWYALRTPLKAFHDLRSSPGQLALFGNAYQITDFECPAMLLRKQQQHSVKWRTRLMFDRSKRAHEAGTAI
ncbi:Arabinanase/levansucrase/invertase, partial [Aureobasidium melanogenum]